MRGRASMPRTEVKHAFAQGLPQAASGRPCVAIRRVLRQKRVGKIMGCRFLTTALLACVLGCGADARPLDASAGEGGADALDDGAIVLPDAWQPPAPILVDGGTECGLPVVTACHDATLWTCCNGGICAGACVLFPDASGPECYCPSASLHGGCPAATVCCGDGEGCITPKACGTLHPPPGGCPTDGG